MTAFALVSGFLLLLVAPLGSLFAQPLAWFTSANLGLCDAIVAAADSLPWASWYVGSIPLWWLFVFYGVGVAWLLAPRLADAFPATNLFQRLRWAAPTGLAAWGCIGLLAGAAGPVSDELRITFLAVGHGGCTVLETPDGRCIVYDSGSLAGPDVARRQVAPFLWARGVRRIDELLVSHADLDHFNGIPGLLERFPIGRVTVTPSFVDKPGPAVVRLIGLLDRRGVPARVARAGDRIRVGEVEMEILHPPDDGPDGPENARSMVVLVKHLGHSVLLTGDLEKEGMEMLLSQPPRSADVVMAPHHGSASAKPARLLEWSRPRLAVASQQAPRWPARGQDHYEKARVPLWRTFEQGAVTLRSHRTGLVAESFATGQRTVVRMGKSDGR